MKRIYITIISVIIASAASFGSVGQVPEKQEFKIPLSNPGQPGTLKVKLHRGSVNVTGYTGNEVVVSIIHVTDEDEKDRESRGGLKRIPNTASEFNITEGDNLVRIQDVDNKESNFEIKVPNDFSLSLNTHHDGYVEVNDVTGEIEVHAHHDDIILNNIGGSVSANTHHGEIKVTFQSVTPDTPMAFSTYHGDIDITFPSNVNGAAKIKTTKGEIYTDFDIEMKAQTAKVESSSSKGTKIQVGGWLMGNIGSGGPEYIFNTYRGDVILRKK